jgi:23S rRNA U2552 (ribose-2'-O)-methylase RlmE/FtsJ
MNGQENDIDQIPYEIWRFYRSLLNPLEMIAPPAWYAKPRLIVPSRAYFKLQEILRMFPLISPEAKKMTFVNLCEAPGGFVKALLDYRTTVRSEGRRSANDGDRYYVITLKGPKIPQFSKDLLKAHPKQIILNPLKCDCDITKGATIEACVKAIGKSAADLITADGGIRTTELNFEEEKETSLLKTSEMILTLSLQKEGGSFVWKLFDTCTQLSADLIWILLHYYENVHLYKPETSRPANSERYIIAMKFKGIPDDELAALRKTEHKERYITNLISEEGIETDEYQNMTRELKVFNGRMMEIQYRKIKEIIQMIKFRDFKLVTGSELEEYQAKQRKIADEFESIVID